MKDRSTHLLGNVDDGHLVLCFQEKYEELCEVLVLTLYPQASH